MNKIIFVTIGWSDSTFPVANKIALMVWDDESLVKVAKTVRKDFADREGCKPSYMTWAVFENVEDEAPVISSANWNPFTMVMPGIIGSEEKY